jgi:hypothetical protein
MDMSGELHAPAALYRGKSTHYPLDNRFCGPHSRSRRCIEERKIALPVIESGLPVRYMPYVDLIIISLKLYTLFLPLRCLRQYLEAVYISEKSQILQNFYFVFM